MTMGEPLHARDHEPVHDVLAAEEFPLGTADPGLRHEPVHDVLAAEEFPLGTADPILHHHGPVILPPDPTGIDAPHDVLAAEEFAMPAPTARHPALARRRRSFAAKLGAAGYTVVVAVLGLAGIAGRQRPLQRRTAGRTG